MRKHLIIFGVTILSLIVGYVSADAQAPKPRAAKGVFVGKVYQESEVDSKAEYPGGDEALLKYVEENIQYPQDQYERSKIYGAEIEAMLIIQDDGKVGNVMIVTNRMFNTKFLENVFKSLPAHKPAKLKGKPVNVKKKVKFTLNPPE